MRRNGISKAPEKAGRPPTRLNGGGPSISAAERIWRTLSVRLAKFVRSRVADRATAEDILQDVFVKLQQRVGEIRNPAKIEGWVFLVARNAVIDYYRKRKPTLELDESHPIEPAATENVEFEELHLRLMQMVDRLPGNYRQAFVLTTFEGYSQEALARFLGISLSGAKSRVQRARERMKDMLLEFCRLEFSRAPGCQPCPRGLFPMTATPDPTAKKKAQASLESRETGKGGKAIL